MDDSASPAALFRINPKLDLAFLAREFAKQGRLHVENFLEPAGAETLYRYLAEGAQWCTFVVANESLLGTPPGVGLTPDEHKEALEQAYEGARSGFACCFDADALFPEDRADSPDQTPAAPDSPLEQFRRFACAPQFIDFARAVIGIDAIATASVQALRFRPGHFVTYHDATRSTDKSRRRIASLFLNLTPEWKPEWGGTLEVSSGEGGTIAGFMPCFISLSALRFPYGHWISSVAPFSGGPQLAVSVRLYVGAS